MRFITKQTINIEILTDNGIPAGTMIGRFYGDDLKIESMKIKPEYLSSNLLGQSVLEMTDAGLSRGAKRILWYYTEQPGSDYTDKKK
jgi:hypothetical protein